MNEAAPVRRLGYVRVSMAREEMISPAIQRAAILDDARRARRQITGWVEDLDATGRNFRRRVMEAIAAVEAGEAAEIGVYRYDRWGRNALECLANVQRVEDAGGAVVSAMERIDVETAMGRFTRRMAFDLAELQSDQIGDGWKAAHGSRVGRQLPASGTPRFGYVRLGRVPDPVRKHVFRPDVSDPAGERYVPDPVTGPVLASLYERYAAGEGIRSLTRELNEAGVPTTRGGRWGHSALLQVLASGFGAGLLRAHDPACRCKRRSTYQCPRVIYHPGAQDPVIGPDVWEAFRARMAARRSVPGRLQEPVYPLSGLLFCGTCGGRLTSTYNYGQAGWGYRCPRRGEMRDCATGVFIRRPVAEGAVLAWLAQWAARIDAGAGTAAPRARARGDALAQREASLSRQLARLMARWAADGHMEEAAYEMARAPLLADLEAVRERMRAAQRATSAGDFRPVVAGLLAEWPTFSPARRREMLSRLIAQVRVHHTGRREPPRIEIIPAWEDGHAAE